MITGCMSADAELVIVLGAKIRTGTHLRWTPFGTSYDATGATEEHRI